MLLKNCNIVRVQICVEKNIFFIRANRKLKFHYKNRKNPDKIRVFLWLYLFCSPLMAEAKGFEPLYRLLGNRISSAGRYDHFDTLPQSHTIISTLRPIVNGCRHIRSAKRMRRKLVRSLNGKRSCNRCK